MRNNILVTWGVIAGDLALLNLFYTLFSPSSANASDINVLQSHILISALYACFAMNSGVVLHRRGTKKYQVIMRVVRNLALFFIIATPIVRWGHFTMLPDWKCYALFLLSSVICVSCYRLSLRNVLQRLRMLPKHVRKVVFVGMSESCVELAKELKNEPWQGYKVCGYFDDEKCADAPDECPRLGLPSDAIGYLMENQGVHGLYCGLPTTRKDEILPLITYCENNLVHFYSVPNVADYLRHRMHFHIIGNVPYLGLHDEPLSRTGNRAVKRLFDICFSLCFLCTLFIPIFLIVAIITKTTMAGPIFFRQKRNGINGINGKEFYCLKFRSMRVNAEADRLQATKDDPRKTKWGNIMRKTNIDELPQFINVLLGDMSIVGPRPHMIKHTEEYSQLIDKYMVRHWVKPGITGWSQVTGYRGETSQLSQMEGRIHRDIWYIEHWSLSLDLYIIYKTVANALRGEKEAY